MHDFVFFFVAIRSHAHRAANEKLYSRSKRDRNFHFDCQFVWNALAFVSDFIKSAQKNAFISLLFLVRAATATRSLNSSNFHSSVHSNFATSEIHCCPSPANICLVLASNTRQIKYFAVVLNNCVLILPVRWRRIKFEYVYARSSIERKSVCGRRCPR